MANIKFRLGDYADKLVRLRDNYEEIAIKAVRAGADIVADEIRKNLKSVLSDEATGELEQSLGITPVSRDKAGNFNAKVGFDGYDSKGVPNQLKARAKESGTSKQKKMPFVRPAVNSTKTRVERTMDKVVYDAVKNIMN